MENQATTTQVTDGQGAEALATTDTSNAVDSTNITSTAGNFEQGGELSGKGEYSLVYYLTFALLMSASAYSIYYHRQALNKLMNSDTDKLKKAIREVKTNLKKLMGNKYDLITK
jgi:hypothetical protein